MYFLSEVKSVLTGRFVVFRVHTYRCTFGTRVNQYCWGISIGFKSREKVTVGRIRSRLDLKFSRKFSSFVLYLYPSLSCFM